MSIIQRVPWTRQPQVPCQLAPPWSNFRFAGAYQTLPGGRYDAVTGKFTPTAGVLVSHGYTPFVGVVGNKLAIAGSDAGAIWYAKLSLDNTSYFDNNYALSTIENYGNNHFQYIGWDDYSLNIVKAVFDYAGYAPVTQTVTLPATQTLVNLVMYVDSVEITVFIDGKEAATTAQTAILGASRIAGQDHSGYSTAYGSRAQNKGTLCAGSFFGSKVVAQNLSKDIWQIYAPLQRRIWVPSAAAPGGFQAAWARNANSVIQGMRA